jgi:hypothetical protein
MKLVQIAILVLLIALAALLGSPGNAESAENGHDSAKQHNEPSNPTLSVVDEMPAEYTDEIATRHQRESTEAHGATIWAALARRWDRFWQWLSDQQTTNALLAIFTFLLVVSQSVQGRWNRISALAAKQSAEVANASLVQLQRAFVYFKDFTFDPLTISVGGTEELHWQCTPRLENGGTTSAKNLRIYGNWAIEDSEINFLTADLDGLGEQTNALEGQRATMGPKSTLGTQPARLPAERLNEASPPSIKKFIYAWGWADYDDIFPGTRRHRTEYCFQLTCVGDASLGDRTVLRFHAVGPHNGHDEECSRQPQERNERQKGSRKT